MHINGRCNGPVSRRGESCYSLLPLAGRRVVQAAARGGTEALSRRRPVGVCGLPVVLGKAGVRRQNCLIKTQARDIV